MDLETIEYNGYQIPIAISFCYSKYNKIYTIFKIIDHSLINQALNNSMKKQDIIDQAVNKLFLDFYTELSHLKRRNWIILRNWLIINMLYRLLIFYRILIIKYDYTK
uniref:hypothetical protein n=1 Tax=Hericium alpestre TaxID=135208 RepID=UPI0024358350|nr:hypothetical protein QEO35_mgp25 [Hericium alpestre]WEX32008.1 hypothetical protein [Hericium alpestre]